MGGLGAPAEFGAYTGAVVNTLTKSGGNRYSGLFDVYWTKESFFGDNIQPEFVAQNPTLADPAVTDKKLDITAQLGGPIIKDKLFFFVAAQRFEVTDNPSGAIEDVTEISPRFNTKLTWQPGPERQPVPQLPVGQLQREGALRLRRRPAAASRSPSNQDSPEAIWGLQWRHLFGSQTFAEVKYTGWWGYYYLDPQVTGPISFDGTTQGYSGGAGYTNAGTTGAATRSTPPSRTSPRPSASTTSSSASRSSAARCADRLGYMDGHLLLRLHRVLPEGPVPGLRLQLRHRGQERARVVLRPGLLEALGAAHHQRRRAGRLRPRQRASCSTRRSTTTPTGRRASASPST